MTTLFVTGAAGYIGSHTVLELQAAGYEVIAFDNLCNQLGGVAEPRAGAQWQALDLR